MNFESDVIISLKNVSKTFRIKERPNSTIRERLTGIFQRPSNIKELVAVNSLNLEIARGEFLGIIGHNGSGKSTLLKLIIGSLKPDKGASISTKGKIIRLALGMGFDPNLSARHNIYVNGSIMGLTFREIGNQFDSIIKFAGLESFVDTPIKFFSSGMVSRLAFSIAMNVNADILLIDEFFGGVGDINFKEKSEDVFKNRIVNGKTIVLVSHDLNVLRDFCNRILIIDNGNAIFLGPTPDAIDYYIQSYGNKKE